MSGGLPIECRAAIIGLSGSRLGGDECQMLREMPPLGIILFRRNIENKSQLTDLVSEIREVLPGALLMVDQEGGRVARLRPPEWHAHPPAASIGCLYARDVDAGLRAAFLTGALIGDDCRNSGFDVVCAPVLDLAVPGADAVIGDRAYASAPEAVSALAGAVAKGLLAAGVQPVGKHVPGHGRAGVDSHLSLPELDDVDEADLIPFRANAWLPWMMTAHIRYRRIDPLHPATLSRPVLQEVVRGRIGFDQVLVSDDLSMHAVSGDPGMLAAASLRAGCDVALHCSGVIEESRSVLHAVPPPDDAARVRLTAAAELAAQARMPVIGAEIQAMAVERDRLLG